MIRCVGEKAEGDGNGDRAGGDREPGELIREELDGEEGDEEDEDGLDEGGAADPAGGLGWPIFARGNGEVLGECGEGRAEHVGVGEDDGDGGGDDDPEPDQIVDESGEDYLYPKTFFRSIALPQSVKKAVLAAA